MASSLESHQPYIQPRYGIRPTLGGAPVKYMLLVYADVRATKEMSH